MAGSFWTLQGRQCVEIKSDNLYYSQFKDDQKFSSQSECNKQKKPVAPFKNLWYIKSDHGQVGGGKDACYSECVRFVSPAPWQSVYIKHFGMYENPKDCIQDCPTKVITSENIFAVVKAQFDKDGNVNKNTYEEKIIFPWYTSKSGKKYQIKSVMKNGVPKITKEGTKMVFPKEPILIPKDITFETKELDTLTYRNGISYMDYKLNTTKDHCRINSWSKLSGWMLVKMEGEHRYQDKHTIKYVLKYNPIKALSIETLKKYIGANKNEALHTYHTNQL